MKQRVRRSSSVSIAVAVLTLCGVRPAAAQFTEKAAAVRYQPSGALDATFGTNGAKVTDVAGSTYEWIVTAAPTQVMFANDRFVAGGTRTSASGVNFLLIRYNTGDGSLDSAFGTAGVRTTNIPGYPKEEIFDLALDSMRRIVVGGRVIDGNDRESTILARYTAAGALDTSFGTNGYTITNGTANGSEGIQSIVIDSSGRTIVGVYRYDQGNRLMVMRRYTATGVLDTTFGTGGSVVTTFPGTPASQVWDVAIDMNGKILAAGGAIDAAGESTPAIARYNTNGSLDTSFSGDGMLTIPFTGHPNTLVTDIAVDFSNNYTIAARRWAIGVSNAEFCLARILPASGALDPMFGTGGKVTTSFSNLSAGPFRCCSR